MDSKTRSYLAGLATNIDSVFQIGKSGVTEELAEQISKCLEKRELVKVTLLKSAGDDLKGIAEVLAIRTYSEVVRVIGSKVILFRRSKTNPHINID